jgi:hypothetical protein
MDNMEQLISNLPSLKYLELHADGQSDLLDGQRWQTATSRLITFNFKFSLSSPPNLKDLDSFRSPFWLHEKHWFVACKDESIFSVPYFAETYTNEEFQPPSLSTLPDKAIFNECITHLTLSSPVADINHRFTRVHTLNTYGSVPLLFMKQIIDLNRIQQLSFISNKYSEFISIINEMPNLYQIRLNREMIYFLEVQCKPFEKIRKLEIITSGRAIDNNGDYSIEKLCAVFPRIEHLHIDHLCSPAEIVNYINQFKQVLSASFCWTSYSIFTDEYSSKDTITVQSALDQNRASQKLNYTYRFDTSSVHVWL